ncbi:MAG: hypothetical protein ABL931_14900 [Usitatibacteraceae bacterium]
MPKFSGGQGVSSGAKGSQASNVIKIAEARKRAAKALANAKQRCNNKKDPSYATYGGAGVRVLIADTDELTNAIGFPMDGYSLDRIDPYGHYEVGNVRWATATVQAANKKHALTNSHRSISAHVAAAKDALRLRENRKETAVGWIWALRAFNDGHLPYDKALWMAEHLPCAGLLEAGFDFNTVFDHANSEPSFVHLPALSMPQARVRIRCSPAMAIPASSGIVRAGRLAGLEYLDASWNVPPSIWRRVSEIVSAQNSGMFLHGMPTTEDLLGGWIEGSSLAMASCIAREFGVSAACYPVLQVNHLLSDLPSPDQWEEYEHRLLDTRVLFIPDLSVDCGTWGDSAFVKWWKIEALLRYRYEFGLPTFVGVQTPQKLPPSLREIVLGAYEGALMPRTLPHACGDLAHASASRGLPMDSVDLRTIAADPMISRLALHDGLQGT